MESQALVLPSCDLPGNSDPDLDQHKEQRKNQSDGDVLAATIAAIETTMEERATYSMIAIVDRSAVVFDKILEMLETSNSFGALDNLETEDVEANIRARDFLPPSP